MYGKSNMETYITIHKIDSQREFSVWLRKLKQGLCINLEGWDGGGTGEGSSRGLLNKHPLYTSGSDCETNKHISLNSTPTQLLLAGSTILMAFLM